MEFFLSGVRPPFFDRIQRGIDRQDDLAACERAITWMMANVKKLEDYWKDKDAADPHPGASVEPKKVSMFIKILSSQMRQEHEATLLKRQGSQSNDQSKAS